MRASRMVAMDLVTVIHPDGGAGDWVLWNDHMGQGDHYPAEQVGWLTRMRDFLEAGLHVAAATEVPRRGHLATGTLGDVTILSGDVSDATPDEIRAMTVVATIVGGVMEYCGDQEICTPGGE